MWGVPCCSVERGWEVKYPLHHCIIGPLGGDNSYGLGILNDAVMSIDFSRRRKNKAEILRDGSKSAV